MKVLGTNVLLKPQKAEQKIIISSHEEELSKFATVIAVGDMVRIIEEGDDIYWSARAGTPIEIDDEEFIIVDASSIFCIL